MARPARFGVMRRDRPELFARACDLESLLNERRARLGMDPVFLTRYGRPLAQAVPAAQPTLPGLAPDDEDADSGVDDDAACDNGACFT